MTCGGRQGRPGAMTEPPAPAGDQWPVPAVRPAAEGAATGERDAKSPVAAQTWVKPFPTSGLERLDAGDQRRLGAGVRLLTPSGPGMWGDGTDMAETVLSLRRPRSRSRGRRTAGREAWFPVPVGGERGSGLAAVRNPEPTAGLWRERSRRWCGSGPTPQRKHGDVHPDEARERSRR